MINSDVRDQLMVLNRELALERVGGDLDLLREVAQLFLDDCPRAVAEIEKAIAAGDAKRLEREAHSLKGSVANFGADPIVRAALALETMGRQERLDGAAAGFTALQQGLRELEPELLRLTQE